MSDLVVVVVIVAVVFCLLVLLVNEFLKGCLRIFKWLEPAWRAAANNLRERLAEGAREQQRLRERAAQLLAEGVREHQRLAAARQQEEQASAGPVVDAVMHGDPADKKRGSFEIKFVVALSVVIIGLVILRSPSDPSVGDAHIRYDGSGSIFITGRIEHVDYEKFVNSTKNIRGKATVFLDSPGGDVVAGLEIGRLIKEKRWSTTVVSGMCESVCGLIWLAGSTRSAISGTVGFHAAYRPDGEVTSSGNARIGRYLGEFGFKDEAIDFFTKAPPKGMNYLTVEKARKYGIDFHEIKSARDFLTESEATISTVVLIKIVLMAGMIFFIGRWFYGKGGRQQWPNVDTNRLEYVQVPSTTAARADTTSRPAANGVGHGTPAGGSNQILSELAAVEDDPVNTVQQSALKTFDRFLITVTALVSTLLFLAILLQATLIG